MDDILVYEMDAILDEYLAKVQKNLDIKKDTNWDYEVRELVYVWQKNEALFRALQKAGLQFRVLDKLSEMFYHFHMKAQHLHELDDKQQYLVYYLAGGVFMVLNKWFENKMDFPIELLTDLFKKAATNIDHIAEEYIAG